MDWEDLLEKEMATHYSTLAWKIPWMEEPGRLQSMGSQESDTTEQLQSVIFSHKGGVICVSELIDISPKHLDSNLCFLQPSVSHDILCI